MVDPAFIPPPNIPPDTRKHSRLGIASLIIALLAAFIICGDVVPVFRITGSLTVSQIYAWIANTLTCISTLLALVGFGLGIVAVVQKNKKKVFGILGLVFNALIVLGICTVIGITMATD
jgi:mannose/fructose/N-acetylgalactosamine-specific phosphotransferase system component IIC